MDLDARPGAPTEGAKLAGPHGQVIAGNVRWARSLRERRRGLLDLPPLGAGEALVLERARQVHTFGMSYAIDVVFCNKDWIVLHVLHALDPRRVTRPVLRSRYAVELPSGAADGLRAGDALQWVVK